MAYQRHKILTGQYVSIEQTPASIGHRTAAYCIDGMIYYGYFMVQSTLSGLYNATPIATYLYAVVFLIPVLYHPICEQLWGGSIGKRLLDMRVVMQNGEPVSIGASILRWLLYIIDTMFAIGLVTMMFNKKNMRLGDIAGGCIVIRGHSSYQSNRLIKPIQHFTYLDPDYKPQFAFAAELSWGQIDFINKTSMRIGNLRYAPNQKANIEQLARMLADKYQVDGINATNSNKFLCTIVSDYNYYTWADTV